MKILVEILLCANLINCLHQIAYEDSGINEIIASLIVAGAYAASAYWIYFK